MKSSVLTIDNFPQVTTSDPDTVSVSTPGPSDDHDEQNFPDSILIVYFFVLLCA